MLGVRHNYYSEDPLTCWAIDSIVDFMEDKVSAHGSIYFPLLGGNPLDESKAPDWFANYWDKVIPVLE